MSQEMKKFSGAEDLRHQQEGNVEAVENTTQNDPPPSGSRMVRFYAHPWTQILLISFICFCLPGVSSAFDRALSW